MNNKKAFFIFAVFALLLLSCGPFTLAPANTGSSNNSSNGDVQQQVNQALASTHLVETQIALSIQQTLAAQGALNPPAITLTSTSTTVRVTVSTATYCRMGPTEAYPMVGTLYVGQTAEVIGRNAYGDSVVIRLPEMTSTTCWLWTAYATFTGNKDGLPIISPPPVPATRTPTTPATIRLCIQNNSAQNILYVYFSHPSEGWGVDRLGSDTLNIGENFCWYNLEPGTYDVKVELSGHVVYKTWYGVSMTSNTQINVP
jgi:hypothetical protein